MVQPPLRGEARQREDRDGERARDQAPLQLLGHRVDDLQLDAGWRMRTAATTWSS